MEPSDAEYWHAIGACEADQTAEAWKQAQVLRKELQERRYQALFSFLFFFFVCVCVFVGWKVCLIWSCVFFLVVFFVFVCVCVVDVYQIFVGVCCEWVWSL